MLRTYKAAVPASAKNKKVSYPVLYLLHGAYGHISDWNRSTPDKTFIRRLAN